MIVTLVGDGLRSQCVPALSQGEGAPAARQTGGAHRHLHGEAVAHICDAVVAHVGNGGVAAGRGIAQGHSIDWHCQRRSDPCGVLPLVVDAVARQHHGGQVASSIAFLDVGEGRGDIGEVAVAVGEACHLEVFLQTARHRVPGLVADGVAVFRHRGRHVVGDYHDGAFLVVHLPLHQGPQQEERQQCHHHEAQRRQRRPCPLRQVGVLVAAQPVERPGIHSSRQQAEEQEIPGIVGQ